MEKIIELEDGLLEHLLKIKEDNLLKLRNEYRCILIYTHGLSQEEADKFLDERDLLHCEICGRSEPMIVDHCHKTKAPRGLICVPCNLGLGMFRDKPDTMIIAINYLLKNSKSSVEIEIKKL